MTDYDDGEGDRTTDCPVGEDLIVRGYESWIAKRLRSQDPCEVLEVVMQCHLPVRLSNDTVLCLCHPNGDGSKSRSALLDGLIEHRQHVAAIQWAALRAAGHAQ